MALGGLQSFIFGGNTDLPTYEALKKRRDIAELLAQKAVGGSPKNVGEGIAAIGNALAYRYLDKKLGPQEDAERRRIVEQLMQIQGGLGPQGISQADLQGLSQVADNPYAPAGIEGVARSLMRRQMTPGFGEGAIPPDIIQKYQGMSGPQDGTPFGWTDPGEVPPEQGPELPPQMWQPPGNVPPIDIKKEPWMIDGNLRGQEPPVQTAMASPSPPPPGFNLEEYLRERQLMNAVHGRGPTTDAEVNQFRGYLQNMPGNRWQSGAGGPMASPGAGPQYAQADTGTATDASVRGDVKLTEGQSKDLNFWNRMDAVTGDIDAQTPALLSAGEKMKDAIPLVGNMMVSDDYQVGRRAANEWITALLRKDTGAQVTAEEWRIYAPLYIPQPGDGEPVLQAKREARARAAEGMKAGLGVAEVLAQELLAQRQQAAPPAPAVGDWRSQDPSTWTDEQLQEFLK